MAHHHAQPELHSDALPRWTVGRMVMLQAVALAAVGLAEYVWDLEQATVLASAMAIVFLGMVGMVVRSALVAASRKGAQAHHALSKAEGDANLADDPAAPLYGKRWSLDVFAAIDAKRFAAVCETWFSWAGFDTRSESHRTDGGVDIWLHAAKMPGPVAIVRCKHWLDRPVGLQEMKEFLRLVAVYQSAHGTYTTTSTYTPEALQFAKENGIDAVDGRGLLRRIQTRTRQSQQALLAVALNGQA